MVHVGDRKKATFTWPRHALAEYNEKINRYKTLHITIV
jgi:hypothetical protein